MDQSKPQSDWSELPLDILMRLTKLLSTSTKVVSFSFSYKLQILQLRAVCKSWRSILPLQNKYDKAPFSCNVPIPITIAPHPSFFPSSYRASSKFYQLSWVLNGSFYFVPSTACIIQSVNSPSSSHLLIVEHLSYESDKVCCRRPLFTTHDRSSSWDINSSKSINLLDYRVSVVAEEYNLRFLINDNGVLRLRKSHENLCKKTVMIWNPNSEELDGVAIVLFDNAVLAEYSLTESKWSVIYDGKKSKCSDIVRYGDGCIFLDHKGNADCVGYDFNSRKLGWTRINDEIRGYHSYQNQGKRLVVDSDCGDLYLVVQDTFLDECGKFKVSFRLNWFSEELHKWERLRRIPGLILFVGIDFSFSANGKDFPAICSGTGNCIFSTVGSFKMQEGREGTDHFFDYIGDDRCVFHLGEHIPDDISNSTSLRNDYNPVFYSPSEWEELLVPPLCPPQCLVGQPAMLAEKKSEQDRGAPSSLAEEHVHHVNHDDPQGIMVSKEEAKKKKRSDHSDSSTHSRLPKKRKVTRSSTEHPGSEETPLALMKKLVACLEHNPVQAHTVQPGNTLREVLLDLGTLPNVEVASNFYFSCCLILHEKENREAYICLANAVAKYKWLCFMCKRFGN